MQKQILMVPPIQFDVHYEINPWMAGQAYCVDKQVAIQQWSALQTAISKHAEVLLTAEPPVNCPDAVFAANAGLALHQLFIPSKFTHQERSAEEPFFIHEFAELGFDVVPQTKNAFEGAGDALFNTGRDVLFMGHGFRTDQSAAGNIAHRSAVHVQCLHLIDPSFYHLDTCFCPLDTGELLWYPAAFDHESQQFIRAFYNSRAIEVSEVDAAAFACNAVSVGDHVLLPLVSAELLETLHGKGLRCAQLDMSQFLKSGGACKCLTLELVR